MKRLLITGALLGLAAAPALAQSNGALCQVHGTATLTPGFTGSPAVETSGFHFDGTLHDCQQPAGIDCNGATVSADGTATGNCPGDAHMGNATVTASPTATGTCAFYYPIAGVCAGPSCTGGNPGPANGALYVLVFDQATIENALSVCSDPTPPHLTSATFDGVLGLGQ